MRAAPILCSSALVAMVACSSGAPGGAPGVAPDGSVPDASTPDALDQDAEPTTPDNPADAAPAEAPDASAALTVGGFARTTANSLNLRSGPGTSNAVLLAMPCGTRVSVVGGPTNGWWNVTDSGTTGWSSGLYLVSEASYNPATCAGGADGGAAQDAGSAGDAGAVSPDVAAIFARAKLGVGYSYYWGHGSWRDDGAQPGACSGSCPSCGHTGQYGADCSGFVAKAWQVPSASPLTTDLHPYSTYNFYNDTTHWAVVPRASVKPADALVYNANGAGHIMLFESGSDPWGSIWTYEARGCSTGVVHNLRVAGSQFIAIRREGL